MRLLFFHYKDPLNMLQLSANHLQTCYRNMFHHVSEAIVASDRQIKISHEMCNSFKS